MTISSETRRNDYTGTGGTATYAFSFLLRAEADLEVKKTDTSGTVTTLVLNTDYTISSVGLPTGGNVVLTSNLELNYKLSLVGKKSPIQETSVRDEGTYYASTHEDEFDNRAIVDLEQKEELGHCVKTPSNVQTSDFDPTLPDDLAGTISSAPITNSAGDGWADPSDWPTGAAINGAAASAAAALAAANAAALEAGTLSPYGINNLGFAASVAASALTIAMKQADGTTDADATDPVAIYFRSATATTGSMSGRGVSAALSVVIPSGATMGHTSAVAQYIYIYGMDNSGTVELAVSSSNHWDEGVVQSSTTIDGTADDGQALYSTTGRSNVPIRLLGRVLSTQATAGTYATAPDVDVGFLFHRKERFVGVGADFTPLNDTIYHTNVATPINVNLPAPTVGFRFIIKKVANDVLTLVRNGSEEIEGTAANFVLETVNVAWEIISDGTDWFFVGGYDHNAEPEADEVLVRTGAGHGSTNNKIRRYGVSTVNTGLPSILYADSAANGMSFTINEAGFYSVVSGEDGTPGALHHGISVNSSQLTTAIESISPAKNDGKLASCEVSSGNQNSVSWSGYLAKDDIIRIHTDGTATGTAASSFAYITQLRKQNTS